MTKKFDRKFLTLSGFNNFASSLLAMFLLKTYVDIFGTEDIAYLFVAQYVGIALSGLLTGALNPYFAPTTIVKSIDFLRLLLIFLLAQSEPAAGALLLFFVCLISLFDGTYHACRYQIIQNCLNDVKERTIFTTQLQSIDSSSMILGPVVGGILLTVLPSSQWLYGLLAVYAINLGWWISFGNSTIQRSIHIVARWFDGYKLLATSPSLRQLNIARILGNVAFVSWNVWLPMWIFARFPIGEFAYFQGLSLGVFACGLFLGNFLIMQIIKKMEDTINLEKIYLRFATVSTCLVFFSFYLLYQIPTFGLLCLVALLIGLSNAALRTVSIVIGQRITPPDSIHLVIAASDGIIRLTTAVIAAIIGVLMSWHFQNDIILLKFFAPILSALGIFFAIFIYKRLV